MLFLTSYYISKKKWGQWHSVNSLSTLMLRTAEAYENVSGFPHNDWLWLLAGSGSCCLFPQDYSYPMSQYLCLTAFFLLWHFPAQTEHQDWRQPQPRAPLGWGPTVWPLIQSPGQAQGLEITQTWEKGWGRWYARSEQAWTLDPLVAPTAKQAWVCLTPSVPWGLMV